MSIRAMNWAWEQQLQPMPKLILMALADNANDHGYCWPKLKTIAAKCSTSERTIQRTIKALLNAGLLQKDARFDANGRQVSNGYTLVLTYPDKLSPPTNGRDGEGDTRVTPGATRLCQGDGDKAMSPLEPPHEPSIESSTQRLTKVAPLDAEERQELARLICGVPAGQQKVITELLFDAVARGSIRSSPSRWLRAVIRRKGHQPTPQAVPALSEVAYVERLIQGGIAKEDALQIARQTYDHRAATKHAAVIATSRRPESKRMEASSNRGPGRSDHDKRCH